jgi:hypothetical protein
MSKNKDGYCRICGSLCEVICSGHRNKPFVDGKNYAQLCHLCYSVPKICELKDEKWEIYTLEDQKLHTANELIEDGWDQADVSKSIKAVRAAIKRSKKS